MQRYRKPTRSERFLDEMNRVVPWHRHGGAAEEDLSKHQDHYRDGACRCELCAIGLRGRSVGLYAQGGRL